MKSALFDGLYLCSYSDFDDINSADLQSANAGDVKKINYRIDSTQTQCAPNLCQNMLKKWDLPSLTASVSAIIDVDDMIGADLGSAYAGDVKNQ